jgi:hypothetical protein
MTTDQKHPPLPENKSISISGDVRDSNIITGDNNTVNQTIIQKTFNIFIHRLLMEHFADTYSETNQK